MIMHGRTICSSTDISMATSEQFVMVVRNDDRMGQSPMEHRGITR